MTWQDLIGTQVAGYTLRTLREAGSHHSEFAATAPDGGEKPVALTLIQPEPEEAAQELDAISRARQLQYPNLLHILDAGEVVVQGVPMLFIVTEGVESTLAATLSAGTPPQPAALLEDILAALEWLHAQGLVYRNLEPETVVRAGGRWKLADLSQLHSAGEFGAAGAAGRSVPPEAAAGTILPAWDIWALGVLLRDAVAGGRGELPVPFDAIVRGCLEPDPRRRISLADIRKLLHPEPPPPPEAQRYEPAPRRSRAPIAVVALAAVVILSVLAFVFLHREGRPAPPPAVPPISHPAAAPAPVPAPSPPPPEAKPKRAAPAEHIGRAEYFADSLEGSITASGEHFSNNAMTAASREFPIGATLRITNLQNGRHVTVRVNDRGPHRRGFIVSVTRRAAEQLGFVKAGSARVKLEVVK